MWPFHRGHGTNGLRPSSDPATPTWPARLLLGAAWFSALWLLAILNLASQTGGSYEDDLVFALAVLPALLWLVLMLASKRARRAPAGRRIAVPLLLGVGVILFMLPPSPPDNPLFRVRWEVSRPAFTACATTLLDGDSCHPRILGLFPVERSHAHRGQARFITRGCGLLDWCGVVYSPEAPPERLREDVFTPLGHGWYHLHEGF